MLSQDAMGKNEISYAFAARQDGSIRQLVVQNGLGELIDMGYFPPGTTKDEATEMIGRQYHWATSFTDDELAKHYNISADRIVVIRNEERDANKNMTFTHMSDKDRNNDC